MRTPTHIPFLLPARRRFSSTLTSTVAASFLLTGGAFAESDFEGPPLVGDPVHGEKLFKRATKKAVRVDGSWINGYTDKQSLKGLRSGKGGFPKIATESELELFDVLAFVRSRNSDLRYLAGDATHALVSKVKYDKHAVERLSDRASLTVGKKQSKHKVFSLYKLDSATGDDLRLVKPKNTKMRDKLTKKRKVGYVVYMPLEGVRDGKHEVAFVVDNDIHITQVAIRGPDGLLPDDLNRVAARLEGRGARGKYDPLKLVGAGKAVRDLQKPLSDAFLRGMEFVYMYEVEERDYFAFAEEEEDDDDAAKSDDSKAGDDE